MTESTSNHMKAPKCASFVARMRQAFGAEQITVLYVKEGEVELGKPDQTEYGHFVLQTPVKKNSSAGVVHETRQEEEEA